MFTIIAVSDSDKHFASAITEYEKRLWKLVKIELIKPFRDQNQNIVIEKETEKIIEILQKKYLHYQKILLIKEGHQYDTLQLANLLQGKETLFIIGGPYGVNTTPILQNFSDIKMLSFGAITLPHGLAKLTLIEQLYRVTTLRSGKKYHY